MSIQQTQNKRDKESNKVKKIKTLTSCLRFDVQNLCEDLWLYRPYLLCSTHFEKGQTLVDVRVG
jgi:hypothetical protein